MQIVLCYPVEPRHIHQIKWAAGSLAGEEIHVLDAGQDHIASAIFDADIFCGHAKVPVDWDRVVDQRRLKWIQSSAAGLDHCLVPAVINSEILVSSASGVFANQVAEHTLALILGLLRGLPTFFRSQQRHEFVRRPTADLRGKTVGIVGFGGNGRRLAEVLVPFQVKIVATDTFPVDQPDYLDSLWPHTELNRLLRSSDIVVLCLPLNDSTHHLISKAEIAVCKPGAMLVNVARGAIVDQQALVAAIESGQLSSAGLDVTEFEPLPVGSPLWDFPQVLITPHVGAQSADRIDRTTQLFCENVRRYLTGKALMNLVDKRLGYPRPEFRSRFNFQ